MKSLSAVKKTLKEIKYSFYLIFHPFNGYWDIKHEKCGSVKTASVFLTVFTLFYILSSRLTGIMFNDNDITRLNLFKDVIMVLSVFFLWCVANWCLTTVMDGEGSFKDIYIMTAYSLLPVILCSLPLIILSRFLSLREAAFYSLILIASQVWTGFLLIIGVLTTHQFTLSRTFFTILLTLLGMLIIVFIALLFFNLIQQMAGFIVNIFNEVSLRM